jgi:dynein light intermediate chain
MTLDQTPQHASGVRFAMAEAALSPAAAAASAAPAPSPSHAPAAEGDLVDVSEETTLDSLLNYDAPEPAPAGFDPKAAQASLAAALASSTKKPGINAILNAVLPPRVYDKDGVLVRQSVSARKAERDDVIALRVKLDERLQERQARESGLCAVREQLYGQAFDELIRQVTIERPERGLLLLRVRDEIKMTIAAYQTLYESSITFGMRKGLQAEQSNTDLIARHRELLELKKKVSLRTRARLSARARLAREHSSPCPDRSSRRSCRRRRVCSTAWRSAPPSTVWRSTRSSKRRSSSSSSRRSTSKALSRASTRAAASRLER